MVSYMRFKTAKSTGAPASYRRGNVVTPTAGTRNKQVHVCQSVLDRNRLPFLHTTHIH